METVIQGRGDRIREERRRVVSAHMSSQQSMRDQSVCSFICFRIITDTRRKVTPGKASGPEASEGPCAAGLGLLGEALAGKLGRVRPRHGSRSDFSGLWVRKRMCLK